MRISRTILPSGLVLFRDKDFCGYRENMTPKEMQETAELQVEAIREQLKRGADRAISISEDGGYHHNRYPGSVYSESDK